ncbi:MAG: hypothetical protein JNK48_16360 [Bryobacterales bacterium]|nr:hypothetical protein [Bryobacterales bacterium]
MKRRFFLLAIPVLAIAEQQGAGPMAGRAVTEIRGTISAVRIGMQSMPSLELQTAGGTEKVVLGSMRYLIEKDFNPKVGTAAIVKGFRVDGYVYARSVQLPEQKINIDLRDEMGRPLWRGMGRKK